MREDNIKKALLFLQNKDGNDKLSSISFEEKKKFLEGKLTEEEIGEVMRRYNSGGNQEKGGANAGGGDSVLANVYNSPVAAERIQHQTSMVQSSLNVISLSILSAAGVTFLMEKIKDRQERNLREEIKSNVESSLNNSQQRIRDLEIENVQMKATMVSKDQVEKIILERLEQHESGKVVGEAKNRALTLKVRASQVGNPSQLSQDSYFNQQTNQQALSKDDVENLKLDLVRELRDMKQNFKEAQLSNQQTLKELKDMNMALARGAPASQIEVGLPGMVKQPVSAANFGPPLQEKSPANESEGASSTLQKQQSIVQEEAKVVAPVVQEFRLVLSEEEKEVIVGKFKDLVSTFGQDKVNFLKFFKIPIKTGISDPSKRVIDISNSMWKRFNTESLIVFLIGIGFTQTTPTRFVFTKPDSTPKEVKEGEEEAIVAEDPFKGNVVVLEILLKMIEEEELK